MKVRNGSLPVTRHNHERMTAFGEAVTLARTLMAAKGVLKFMIDVIRSGARLVEKIFGNDDDELVVPQSAVIDALEHLLKSFNEGTILSCANIYNHCNGDVLPASVRNHLKGRMAFQKSAWQATVDCERNVRTGTPASHNNVATISGSTAASRIADRGVDASSHLDGGLGSFIVRHLLQDGRTIASRILTFHPEGSRGARAQWTATNTRTGRLRSVLFLDLAPILDSPPPQIELIMRA
jgi:hypothetical protein